MVVVLLWWSGDVMVPVTEVTNDECVSGDNSEVVIMRTVTGVIIESHCTE